VTFSPLWATVLALLAPIPIGADRKLRRLPWVTISLIAANLIGYLLTRPDLGGSSALATFSRWGLVPGHPTLAGAVASLFLHVSLLHLFWNMVFLWLFGAHVEEALGGGIYAATYLVGGVVAGLLHAAICRLMAPMHPELLQTPLVGASGAVSAILAPYAIRFYRSRVRLIWVPGLIFARRSLGAFDAPATAVIAVWLAENVVGAVRGALDPSSGGVAYWAHVGGFVTGLVAAELAGLLGKGWTDYVLEDARAAARRGHAGSEKAAERYRAYLQTHPADWRVRLELAALLAHDGDPAAQAEGNREVSATVRKEMAGADALACYMAATAQGLRPDLPVSDRVQLARLAEEAGDGRTATQLLRAVVAAGVDGAEDETARLRLAQLVARADPGEADRILAAFMEKYPRSAWRPVAEQRRADLAARPRGSR